MYRGITASSSNRSLVWNALRPLLNCELCVRSFLISHPVILSGLLRLFAFGALCRSTARPLTGVSFFFLSALHPTTHHTRSTPSLRLLHPSFCSYCSLPDTSPPFASSLPSSFPEPTLRPSFLPSPPFSLPPFAFLLPFPLFFSFCLAFSTHICYIPTTME
jgi:hypothetical protein